MTTGGNWRANLRTESYAPSFDEIYSLLCRNLGIDLRVRGDPGRIHIVPIGLHNIMTEAMHCGERVGQLRPLGYDFQGMRPRHGRQIVSSRGGSLHDVLQEEALLIDVRGVYVQLRAGESVLRRDIQFTCKSLMDCAMSTLACSNARY